MCQAQKEAIRLGENGVATEHLLLGLVREGNCAGSRILAEKLGVPLDRVAEDVERRVNPGAGRRETLDLVLTPGSRNALDYAQEGAVRLGHRYIGSEHLLLGLIREAGVLAGRVLAGALAGRVLAGAGVTLERAREMVQDWQAR